jgi:uncharacterized protein DUF5681
LDPDSNDAQSNPEPFKGTGYGKPPEATRFKKGASGNPKGRPKGSLNVATVFIKALREKVVINENGQRKTVTKLEAALKQMVNKAASGEIRALRELLALARDAEAKQNASVVQNTAIEGLDQDVIDGIMHRFLEAKEEQQPEIPEASHGGT